MRTLKQRFVVVCAVLVLLSCLAAGSAAAALAGVADASQMTAVEEVVEEGMSPVSGELLQDGEYDVKAESSSSMFRIEECMLHVADGAMRVSMSMGGTGYLYVFPGTAEEAAAAEESRWIPYTTDDEGRHVFTIPLEALDKGVPCAAFSRNKELWYDRTLVFRADSLPADAFRPGVLMTTENMALTDGEYRINVSLSGGSGRAKLETPALLRVEKGTWTARLVWGSKNYDYMIVDGSRILPLEGEETSTFEIPLKVLDRPMAVIADTVAMGTPHEIEYRLLFDSTSLTAADGEETAQSKKEDTGKKPDVNTAAETVPAAALIPREESDRSLRPMFAEQFQTEKRPDGSILLTLRGKDRYLLLERNAELTEDISEDVTVIRIPVQRVYAASSSVPDLFLHSGALDSLRFTGTNEASWRIPQIKEAMEKKSILYAGKYSAPDYELLLEEGCDLVIENTMILHNPAVREKLEALGLPVLVEYSSYEPQPLGRVEWIRLYGLLTGNEKESERFFAEQCNLLTELTAAQPTGRTAAFFHVTANGSVTVRRHADYVTRMIELAGGSSPFHDLPRDDEALSSMTIGMESFYEQAKDADVLIYNSTVAGDLETLDDLLRKNSLFSDFRAVRNGEVWCTEQSMFQQSSMTAVVIADLRSILSGQAEGRERLTWLYRLSPASETY